MRFDRVWLLIAGLGCILCPSIGMLAASYYNRSGRPLSVLTLSQRELRLPTGDSATQESSALTLGLIWRVEGARHSDFANQPSDSTPVNWLTAQKRAALGLKSDDRRSSVSAFLVLEFNGRNYAQALKQACRAADSDRCTSVRNLESRLYVIDAGSDAKVLRTQYPDAAVYAVVPGVLTLSPTSDGASPSIAIGGIDIDTVQAVEPLRSAKTSSGDMSWYSLLNGKPFQADIAFGHRSEPWNVSISAGVNATTPMP